MLGVGLGLTQPRGRAAGFSPSDIADLAGWWDASDTTTITESSGFVSQVDDKSGNGLHLVQPTGSEQPSTGVDTINDLNVITQLPLDSLITNAVLPVSSTFSFYAVLSGTTGNDGSVWNGTSSNGLYIGFFQSGSTVTVINNGISTPTLATVNRVTQVTRGDMHTALQTTGIMSWVGWSPSTADTWWTRYRVTLVGGPEKIGEIILYDRALSSEETGQVEDYLAGKWGVTLP